MQEAEVRPGAEVTVLAQAKAPLAVQVAGGDLVPAQAKALVMREVGQVLLELSPVGTEVMVNQGET